MSPTLLRLAAELLDLAADEFGNHGCNDFKMTGRFTDSERTALADLLNRWQFKGRDLAKADRDDIETADRLKDWSMDWILMRGLAHGLREEADKCLT